MSLMESKSGRVLFIYFILFRGARWTPLRPKRWFLNQVEIREKKRRHVGRRKAKGKDAEKAALADDAPSSQLTESVINRLLLKGNMQKHQAWLPNTLTWNISEAYHCIHTSNTRRAIPQRAEGLELSLNSLDKTFYYIVPIWEGGEPKGVVGYLFLQSDMLFKGFNQQNILLLNEFSLTGLKTIWVAFTVMWLCSWAKTLVCFWKRSVKLTHAGLVRNIWLVWSKTRQVSCVVSGHAWVCLIWWPGQPWC